MALELYHEVGFRSMKSDALQGREPFSRDPALFTDLNPARNSTVRIDRSD